MQSVFYRRENTSFELEPLKQIMAEKKYFLLPVLGLPFEIGTLYNANTNQIVPGISLWEYEDRNANVHVCENPCHKSYMTTEESLESKLDSLDIRGNLIITVLANKVDVKGSVAFLKEMKSSKAQARLVLERRGTTKDKYVSNNHFSKEKVNRHSEFIRNSGATHVVCRITYGYECFLMLETICESEEEKLKVEEIMKLKVADPRQGEVKGWYETKEEKKLNKLTVKTIGTVEIPSIPTSFEEAIVIYKRFPELVKYNECPMEVHLLPLATICQSLPKYNPIKENVLISVTAVFEDISNLEVALSGIQTSDIATIEPRIRRKAKTLSTLLKGHRIWMQMKMYDIISDSKMENDSSRSKQIEKVLKKHENSPFLNEILGKYVSKMEKEVCFMRNLVRMFTISNDDGISGDGNITIDILSDETNFLIPFEICKVFVLEIPIVRVEDNLLKEMQKYDPDIDGSVPRRAEAFTLPFEDEKLQRKILKCAKDFVKLAYTNEDNGPAKFRCVFKGHGINAEPTINVYSASTGDIEPYYHKSPEPRSVSLGDRNEGEPKISAYKAPTAALFTRRSHMPSQNVRSLMSRFEGKS